MTHEDDKTLVDALAAARHAGRLGIEATRDPETQPGHDEQQQDELLVGVVIEGAEALRECEPSEGAVFSQHRGGRSPFGGSRWRIVGAIPAG